MYKPQIYLEELTNLIKGCKANDRQAQSELYKLFSKKMLGVCVRYSPSLEEAEDSLQEGFFKVFKNIGQYQFKGSFEGWIRKIMVNCALQKHKTKAHIHAVLNLEDEYLELEGYNDIFPHLEARELLKIIQSLPPAYRMVFNLYVFEELKHREIAKLLGVSEGTSKSNLSDARALLRKAVAKNLLVAKQK